MGENKKFKFDVIIGNPPYQEDTDSESTRMPPIYDKFMDASFGIAEKTEFIHPARFLFNGKLQVEIEQKYNQETLSSA